MSLYGTVRGRDGAPKADARRFDRKGREKPAQRVRDAEYRCAECGRRGHTSLFLEGGWLPRQCPDHPEADMLSWDWTHQAAALYVHTRIHTARDTFIAINNEIEHDVAEGIDTPRLRALMVVLPLLEQWGGLPERMPLPTTPGVSRPSLY